MSRLLIALGACAALAFSKTVPVTNVTYTTRACAGQYANFPFCDTGLSIPERVADLLSRLELTDIPPQLTARHNVTGQDGPLSNISRLGVPEYDWGANAAHGLQSACVQDGGGAIYCPTSFPNPVNMGALWNASAVQAMAGVIATEARALWLAGATEENGNPVPPHMGLDMWSPVINVVMDPRWGRNQECFSEDPLIISDAGVAFTRGLQEGEDPSRLKTVVTLKHWTAYQLEDLGNITRYNFNAVVSNYSLADTYYAPFKAAVVAGGARGVMCSYNALNGVPTCASSTLASALRDSWGFDGYVTSDSGAIDQFQGGHQYVNSSEAAACVALSDGQTDVCSGRVYQSSLLSALNDSLCGMDVVTRALNHTFSLRFALGLFDPPASTPYWSVPLSAVNTTASRALSADMSAASMVLLKHDGATLPLASGSNIAILGPHAEAQHALLGNYIGQICPSPTGAPEDLFCLQHLNTAITTSNGGSGVNVAYGCTDVQCNSTEGFPAALAVAAAADVVILALGIDDTVEAEMLDRVNISLPGNQTALATAVAALGKPIVVVLINAGALDVTLLRDDARFNAILSAGYPGFFGAQAIADTLFGKNDRCCGKLPATWFPASFVDSISMTVEDLDVGVGRTYRYWNGSAVYPFGHGLALTQFSVKPKSIPPPVSAVLPTSSSSSPGATLTYTFQVNNVGTRTGDTVLQAYFSPTFLPTQPLNRLRSQLFAYERVHLAAGAGVSVSFTVSSASVSLVDKDSAARVSSPGNYTLTFADGAGASLTFPLTITGQEQVISAFP